MTTALGLLGLDDERREPHAVAGLAEAFVLGRPADRLQLVWGELVSFVDLFRADLGARLDRDRPPFAIAFAKLLGMIVVGIVFLSAVAAGIGTALVRAAVSFIS
ncbi:MAG TPA: hypothetical protein VE669_05685 [Actinomycetota bacterium]|jgi:hypothetical protein|nr:hypothetical protein [Actinomycetota bacterium]